MAIHLATSTRNAMCDAVDTLISAGAAAGKLIIYTGTQHGTPGTLPAGTALATFTLPDPAFAAASSGSMTLNTVATVQGSSTGTAGCFAVMDSDNNVVFDGTVTATSGGGDLELNTTSITTGVDVSITSGTFTMPSGA